MIGSLISLFHFRQLASSVSNSKIWAGFPDISHFEFKFPVCLPFRLMFPHRAPPGLLSSLTADSSPPPSASWASRLIASSSTSFCQRSSRAASELSPRGPAAWAGLHRHGHGIHLLRLFLLLRTLPGIPQARVRLSPALSIILFPPVSALTGGFVCVV